MEASADMNLNANVNQVIHPKSDFVRSLTLKFQGFWGPECENDACSGNPCLNNGVCTLTGDKSSFTCNCESGYYGDFCELDESVNGMKNKPKAVLTLNAETQKNLKMMRKVALTPFDRYGYEPLAMLYKFDDGNY